MTERLQRREEYRGGNTEVGIHKKYVGNTDRSRKRQVRSMREMKDLRREWVVCFKRCTSDQANLPGCSFDSAFPAVLLRVSLPP